MKNKHDAYKGFETWRNALFDDHENATMDHFYVGVVIAFAYHSAFNTPVISQVLT